MFVSSAIQASFQMRADMSVPCWYDSAVRVAAVPNDFFGRAIGVAGLLTGRDIQRHLATLPDLGRAVLVPAVALRDVDGVFLDDATPADLARDLGVPVRVVEPSPGALLEALRDVG